MLLNSAIGRLKSNNIALQIAVNLQNGEPIRKMPPIPPFRNNKAFNAWVKRTKATIRLADWPTYVRSADCINMPSPRRWIFVTHTYQTALLHELAHWTGKRVGRNLDSIKHYGDPSYLLEEAVAELTAAMLSDDLGIYHCIEWSVHYIRMHKAQAFVDEAIPLARTAAEYLKSLAGDRL
jgi:antirestriction protein ArdC